MIKFTWRVGWMLMCLAWLVGACAVPVATSPVPIETATISKLTYTSTFTSAPASTPTTTRTASPHYTPVQTPFSVPVSTEVKTFFVDLLDIQGQSWNVNIRPLDLYYEKKEGGGLVLNAHIQCLPGASPCELWMPRWAFIFNFSNPEPQPGDLAFFPSDLEGFKVHGYDASLNLLYEFSGKWSDLVEYEQGLIPDHELEERLIHP